MTIAQAIDRQGRPTYDHIAADDLADVLHAVAEILERNRIALTREGWRKTIFDAIAMVEAIHERGDEP